MSERLEAPVQGGLNDYQFVVSLHLDHPSITPERMIAAVQLEPVSSHRRGEPRTTPKGHPLSGEWPSNYAQFLLPIKSGDNPSKFLLSLTKHLASKKSFFRELNSAGGSACVFFGLFADRCCDFELPAEILQEVGDLGLSVRFDFYGPSVDRDA